MDIKRIIANVAICMLMIFCIMSDQATASASTTLWQAFQGIERELGTEEYTLAQTISDGAQRTTIAFSGLGIITGNLAAQSFFPPGKVADYTGFQYLRDNDPDNMGHNTSFLTRVANNVIYILNDAQFNQLKALAVSQLDQINQYGYQRYPLMQAFRRLLDGNIPSGSTGLSLSAVRQASRELYLLDGQISFDRAMLYANVINSMTTEQKAYLIAMKGKGFNSWPNITDAQVQGRMAGLPQGTAVAVMTYAGDLFSWYAGSVNADVYFCPERHGTYYGSFYMKDAPAVGHEGYSIDEQLTATAGSALCDSSQGYVTQQQAALISSLVETQRNNLYASATSNIVQIRTQIASLLRSLLVSTATSDTVKAQVLDLSGTYGDLDGENNYHYATVFAQVYKTLTSEQKNKLTALRQSILSGTYSDGTPFDYTVCTTPFLYSNTVSNASIEPYIADTDYLFSPNVASFGYVGVGVNPPQKILHVSGTGRGTAPLFQRGTDSAGFIIERTPTNRWVFGVNESPALGYGFVIATIPEGTTSVPRLVISPSGNVTIPGSLSAGTKNFRIDHPLDPADKYLLHSFVESPDMLNLYSGNVVLDDRGEAVVELPGYFGALNRDYTYQLDTLGGFAPLYISQEIRDSRFKIAGGKAGMRVSWQVTGIRQDPYAEAHPIIVEQDKPVGEKGFYLHPVEWGYPPEKGILQLNK